MQGNDERGSPKKIRKIREIVYSISFLRPLPRDVIKQVFLTDSLEFSVDKTKINIILDERNDNFVKQVSFIGGDVQKFVNYILFYLGKSLKLEDIIWSYEVFMEAEADLNEILKTIKVPSVLPLIGNVTNYGLILSNDPDFKMMVRNFTTVQIDKYVRIIKRSQNFIDISVILDELEKLLYKIKTG